MMGSGWTSALQTRRCLARARRAGRRGWAAAGAAGPRGPRAAEHELSRTANRRPAGTGVGRRRNPGRAACAAGGRERVRWSERALTAGWLKCSAGPVEMNASVCQSESRAENPAVSVSHPRRHHRRSGLSRLPSWCWCCAEFSLGSTGTRLTARKFCLRLRRLLVLCSGLLRPQNSSATGGPIARR